jgi:hypothetical protein
MLGQGMLFRAQGERGDTGSDETISWLSSMSVVPSINVAQSASSLHAMIMCLVKSWRTQ